MGLFGKSVPSRAELENEFGDLLQTQIIEFVSRGIQGNEVSELATNRTAEILMKKYGLSTTEIVKIAEGSVRKLGRL